MSENCKIGLHSFKDWQDQPKSATQTRKCRECGVVEERVWQHDEDRPGPYDAYRDLYR